MSTRDETKELDILYRVSHLAASHNKNIQTMLEQVLFILSENFGVLRGTFTLRRSDDDTFVVSASIGLTKAQEKRGRYKLGEGITGNVAKTETTAIIPNVDEESAFLEKTKKRQKSGIAFICVPILHAKRIIGTFSIDLSPSDKEDLDRKKHFFELIANILAESVFAVREQIEEREDLRKENQTLRLQLKDKYSLDKIIGRCGNMRIVFQQIAQVADSNATVLIRGDSGTGKELVASAIHFNSSRKSNPLVCVNCAALPENLIESELFGHKKGAFTGASQSRKGRFEKANGGTIFLDEIGDISLNIQVRLLRVLQEQTIMPVGEDSEKKINVRVIAATNKDLEKAMKEGTFREDLYYRLNVFPLHLPRLRERKSDIILLSDHFLQKYNEEYDKNVRRISTSAINMMMAYHWPGNVRELENCIERAVLTSSDEVIHAFNLPPSLQTCDETYTGIIPEQGADLKTLLSSYEKELIVDSLKTTRGNIAGTARFLNTTERVLHYSIKKLNIDVEQYK
ncbi:MAG: sigma 54-interacting transcriptional regulator [Verrucomicrobiota bacterium]|nr:sigma 54-interacting transcriptional regulator [Verrucomicrobiota bacterium]